MSRSERNKKRKNKKSIILKIIITILIISIFLFGIGFAIFFTTFNKIDNVTLDKNNLSIPPKEELEIYSDYEKIKNIALFGIDSTDGVGRSDSTMIATIDPIHNKLKIISLMRDSYVNIDGYGYDKLNHAYAFGGAELSIKTINQSFGLNIEDFVAVDFASLPKIIDILGGIELDISSEELQYINGYIDDINYKDGTSSPYISYAGPQHVDGVQALAYSRIRYTSGGDYERTRRHRTVLEKLFNKAITLSPTQYSTLINQLLPYVKTNLTASDILSLVTKVAMIGSSSLEQDRFPRDGYCWGENINGIYYLAFDESSTKQQIMDYVFDDK